MKKKQIKKNKTKQRTEIPPAIAAKVMFLSDRTCCLCRKQGKTTQIHHIDEDKNNHDMSNLAVLCFECHNKTLIKGGFHRKLNAEQIILYRDNWHMIITQKRIGRDIKESKEKDNGFFLRKITTQLDILRENKDYNMMAYIYETLGNADLRDKYIDLSLKQGVSEGQLISLRALQKRIDLIPKDTIKKVVKQLQEKELWSELARTYVDLQEHKEAVRNYCKYILQNLDDNSFTAAYYLKELCQGKLWGSLFEREYEERVKKNDLWWQIRCLQELGWKSEVFETLMKNKDKIEKSDNMNLKTLLYSYLKDENKFFETIREKYLKKKKLLEQT